ncbi:MAG: hypothetical protein FJ041_05650 [Candidatus Cloacimonetes bacterium]|nr:hypothetical protein [Candidatus Cloacimonadota bacterium]
MKRFVPLLITFIVGIIVLSSEFIPHKPFSSVNEGLENWFLIISGFAIILGQLSLIKVNSMKVADKAENWKFYLAGLIAFAVMLLCGILWGTQDAKGLLGNGDLIIAILGKKPFEYLFSNIYQHLSATMFALLAFFIASAAYRAFIVRSFESTLLMIAAVLVMLGRTSIGTSFTAWLPQQWKFLHLPNIADFIMNYPNNAAQRAIMISAALGIVGSSLRILLGIERSYLGGSD